MNVSRKQLIVGGVVLALAAGGAGTAVAVGSGDDDEGAATGPGADKAKAAALALYPGATAGEVENASDEGAAWEVEVKKADGSSIDVHLDQNYQQVAGAESDDEDQGEDQDEDEGGE